MKREEVREEPEESVLKPQWAKALAQEFECLESRPMEANPEREKMDRKLNTDEAARNAKLAQQRLRMLHLINDEVPKKEDLCELRRLHEQALAAYMRWVRLYGEPECEARGCHCG